MSSVKEANEKQMNEQHWMNCLMEIGANIFDFSRRVRHWPKKTNGKKKRQKRKCTGVIDVHFKRKLFVGVFFFSSLEFWIINAVNDPMDTAIDDPSSASSIDPERLQIHTIKTIRWTDKTEKSDFFSVHFEWKEGKNSN